MKKQSSEETVSKILLIPTHEGILTTIQPRQSPIALIKRAPRIVSGVIRYVPGILCE